MKRTILLTAVIAVLTSCTQEPTKCELFGVSLGMNKEEALAAITDKFGRTEYDGTMHTLQNIYSDGVKYKDVAFGFSDGGELAYISAWLPDIEDFYPHPDTEAKVIAMLLEELGRVDSFLSIKHNIYNVPIPVTDDLSNDLVTIAAKDIYNADDMIGVYVKTYDYKVNSYSVNIVLRPTKKNRYYNY